LLFWQRSCPSGERSSHPAHQQKVVYSLTEAAIEEAMAATGDGR
jgi:hypothetical protein